MSGEILLMDMSIMERVTVHLASGSENEDQDIESSKQLISPYEAGDLLLNPQSLCTVCGLPVERPFSSVKFVEVGHRPCLDASNLQRGMELISASITDVADELLIPTALELQGPASHEPLEVFKTLYKDGINPKTCAPDPKPPKNNP